MYVSTQNVATMCTWDKRYNIIYIYIYSRTKKRGLFLLRKLHACFTVEALMDYWSLNNRLWAWTGLFGAYFSSRMRNVTWLKKKLKKKPQHLTLDH